MISNQSKKRLNKKCLKINIEMLSNQQNSCLISKVRNHLTLIRLILLNTLKHNSTCKVCFSQSRWTQETRVFKLLHSIPSRPTTTIKETSNHRKVLKPTTTTSQTTMMMVPRLSILVDLTYRLKMTKISKLLVDSSEQKEWTWSELLKFAAAMRQSLPM